MKLAPPWFNGDHGAKVCLVTQQLCNQLVWNRLSLRFKTADETWGCDVEAGGSCEGRQKMRLKKRNARTKRMREKRKTKFQRELSFSLI